MSDKLNPMRQRLVDYLHSQGLEPAKMAMDGWTQAGFRGVNLMTGEVGDFYPWPDGFDYKWFQTLFKVADAEDYRLAGYRAPV